MIKPIRNNVLIKPFAGKEITDGGLIIPENLRTPSNKGIVSAVGNGSKGRPMRLNVGEIDFKVKDWGTPVESDGELYYLMDENAVLATD